MIQVLHRLRFVLYLCMVGTLGISAGYAVETVPAPKIEARAWILVDAASGATLAAHDADRPLPPASLTKLLSAYLVFEALRDGRLRRDATLEIGPDATRTAGARMFLTPGQRVRVDDLIRGMLIISANDAALGLANAVAGDTPTFVKRMNETAARLGMRASRFVNVTGQHDPKHVATARDLALLSSALMRVFPQEYAYFGQKSFEYAGVAHDNKNRLLWLDPNIDGVKTGQTDAAGYCLVASTRRDNRRLVSVVLGASSDQARALESLKLLNHGLSAFETLRLYTANTPVKTFRVYKGSGSQVNAGFMSDFHVTLPRGSAAGLKADIVAKQPLMAPIRAGASVATLRLSLDGKPYLEAPLLALNEIPVGNILGRLWDSLMLLFRP